MWELQEGKGTGGNTFPASDGETLASKPVTPG